MKTIALFNPIRDDLERVERKMRQAIQTEHEQLTEVLQYLLANGGKRIRPALVLLSSRFHPADEDKVMALAAAVEILHTATLVHDDLIDGSLLRRGKPTLNTFWGPGATVLTGDYLFSQAASLAADTQNIRVVTIFSHTLAIICWGELRQLFSEGTNQLTRENYYRRISSKTASLFATSAEAGAVLSNAPEEETQALRDYGHNLGMAFQIIDDVLDFIGDEAQMGKPAGSDLQRGIVTLPTLHFLSQGNDPETVLQVLNGAQRDETTVRAAVDAICASGAIEAAVAEAHRFSQCAQEALQVLPANQHRRILFDLADFIIQRDY
ncbi:MAG: polyprenyl synthetase family protein [Anaerolineae bacterium]|nr:polyprenyl synthetase family protein [Anaerolineae bacterium]MDH7474134.1 polyprenyl synthetase family protein [Anaerolineae bacterium]